MRSTNNKQRINKEGCISFCYTEKRHVEQFKGELGVPEIVSLGSPCFLTHRELLLQ